MSIAAKMASNVALQGALTIANGQAQREQLLAALESGAAELALDLSAIDAFDSAGVQLLLATRRTLAERGGSLVLHGAGEVVTDVLSLFGLEALLCRPVTA